MLQLQIRNIQIRLKRAHPPRLILPHHKFHVILSRWQADPSVILHILLLHLRRAIYCQLHRIANPRHRMPLAIHHHANHIERSLIPIAVPRKSNL